MFLWYIFADIFSAKIFMQRTGKQKFRPKTINPRKERFPNLLLALGDTQILYF